MKAVTVARGLLVGTVASAALATACANPPPPQSSDDGVERHTPSEAPADRRHAQYLHQCMQTPEWKDFCECGWDALSKVAPTQTEERTNDDQLAAQKRELRVKCGDRLPEQWLRENYVRECSNADAAMIAYCRCTWTELRKTVSIGEIARSNSPEAYAPAAKACSGELPVENVRARFVAGCAKQTGFDAFCSCAWTAIREQMSLGEIQSGERTPARQSAMQAASKRCSGLLPPGAK